MASPLHGTGKQSVQRSLRSGNTIQRLILMIGTPGVKADTDFPTHAANLLSSSTREPVKAYTMYQHPAHTGFLSLFTSPTKHTLYIVAHGTSASITGFASAKALGDSLKGKNLSSTTLSKIVLVSCSTGAQGAAGDPSNFARALATEMQVDVYAATNLISVEYVETTKNQETVRVPIKFQVGGLDVGVVGGADLTKFSPDGEGYVPPVLQNAAAAT